MNEKTCPSAANNSRYIHDLYELFSRNKLICKPTSVTLTTSTLVDHTSTTCIDNILESGVHKVSLSQHYMVFCKRTMNAGLGGGHKLVITRNMKHFDKNAFLRDIYSIRCNQVVNKTDNVGVMIKEWTSLLSAVMEKHAPIREVRVSDRNCTWINRELKLLMKSGDKLKKQPLSINLRLLWISIEKFRIKLIPLMFG